MGRRKPRRESRPPRATERAQAPGPAPFHTGLRPIRAGWTTTALRRPMSTAVWPGALRRTSAATRGSAVGRTASARNHSLRRTGATTWPDARGRTVAPRPEVRCRRTGWTAWPVAMPGWTGNSMTQAGTWYGPVHPVLALWIPRAPQIVRIPVIAEGECDDADADQRAIRQHRHLGALVGIHDVARINPPAVGAGHHITPPIVAQTPLHGDRDARTQPGNDGVLHCGSGAKIHVLGGTRPLCRPCRGHSRQSSSHKPQSSQVFHHRPPSVGHFQCLAFGPGVHCQSPADVPDWHRPFPAPQGTERPAPPLRTPGQVSGHLGNQTEHKPETRRHEEHQVKLGKKAAERFQFNKRPAPEVDFHQAMES